MMLLKFKTENVAFEGNEAGEVARLLRDVATKIDQGRVDGMIFDTNGNRVGSWDFSAEHTNEEEEG